MNEKGFEPSASSFFVIIDDAERIRYNLCAKVGERRIFGDLARVSETYPVSEGVGLPLTAREVGTAGVYLVETRAKFDRAADSPQR